MNFRLPFAAISLSAAAWAAYVAVPEGWMGTAAIPTKNDRCTNGFGSTIREDGSPVACGEVITPVQAVTRSLAHIAKDETGLKKCVIGEALQAEFDILFSFSYQYGVSATCKSNVVKYINSGEYLKACNAYTEYKYLTTAVATPGWTPFKYDAAGAPIRWRFDCSTPGNKVCAGVWTRNLERRDRCLAAQSVPTPTPIPTIVAPVEPDPVEIEQPKSWWTRIREWFA